MGCTHNLIKDSKCTRKLNSVRTVESFGLLQVIAVTAENGVTDLLKRFGVDVKSLSMTPKGVTPKNLQGRILLYDGDGACYTHTNGVAKIETALRRFHEDIETHMLLANCSSARVHLTPRGCFKNGRHLLNTVKPYQDNRTGVQKPPLLEVLRSQAQIYFEKHPHIEIIANYDIEADDGLMIDAHSIPNSVMISPDKDLRINPFESYNVDDGVFERLPAGDTFGWIDRKFWLTPSGKTSSKMIGKGSKFFWAQMLMGDQADNVQGILKYNGKLCGEAGAYDVLSTIQDANEACNAVIDGYRAINQNIIAEGEALWLLRDHNDNVYRFINEHELSPANKQFVEDCYAADWRKVGDETSD